HVMCTFCPMPCRECAIDEGRGAFCAATPCGCACHPRKRDAPPPRDCDSYIHDFAFPMCLRWWLFVNRLSAADQMLCRQNGVKPTLFASYQGRRWRVVMASR